MKVPSLNRTPSLPVALTLSEPAKSTKFYYNHRTLIHQWKMGILGKPYSRLLGTDSLILGVMQILIGLHAHERYVRVMSRCPQHR